MPYRPIQIIRRAILLLLAFFCCSPRSFALGETDYIATNAAPGSFPLVSGTVANLVVDTNDWVGVIRAADDFKTDEIGRAHV